MKTANLLATLLLVLLVYEKGVKVGNGERTCQQYLGIECTPETCGRQCDAKYGAGANGSCEIYQARRYVLCLCTYPCYLPGCHASAPAPAARS